MVTNMDYYTRQHEIEMKELEVLGVLGLVAIPCVTIGAGVYWAGIFIHKKIQDRKRCNL